MQTSLPTRLHVKYTPEQDKSLQKICEWMVESNWHETQSIVDLSDALIYNGFQDTTENINALLKWFEAEIRKTEIVYPEVSAIASVFIPENHELGPVSKKVSFSANLWLSNVTDAEILKVFYNDNGQQSNTREVVYYLEDTIPELKELTAIDGDGWYLTCHLNTTETRLWLQEHRPHLIEIINQGGLYHPTPF